MGDVVPDGTSALLLLWLSNLTIQRPFQARPMPPASCGLKIKWIWLGIRRQGIQSS